jgi:hypothetical protein
MAESFHEYRHTRQAPGEPRLRWFQCDYFELFVWFDDADAPLAFRLCYERGYSQERAITWEKASGRIRHDAVDGGGSIGSYAPSATLVAHCNSIPAKVIERFRQTPGEIPTEIRQLVIGQLEAKIAAPGG